jgi:hypothetical protein
MPKTRGEQSLVRVRVRPNDPGMAAVAKVLEEGLQAWLDTPATDPLIEYLLERQSYNDAAGRQGRTVDKQLDLLGERIGDYILGLAEGYHRVRTLETEQTENEPTADAHERP